MNSLLINVFLTVGLISGSAHAAKEVGMEEIAALLPKNPVGIGCPIEDRAAWESLAEVDSAKQTIRTAEGLLDEPIPELTDDLYLDFSRTGNRRRCEQVMGQRFNRFRVFALAECLENKGRFLAPLEEIIGDLCSDKSWLLPAHDPSLVNFKGELVTIDLASANLGWSMATVDYILREKLSPEARQLIRENLDKRILTPFLDMIEGRREKIHWLNVTNNWNSVCLAGVVGTALAVVKDRQERAKFIVAGRDYSKNFLRGFGSDGYCSEGLAYWNYGFGHYLLLAEMILQATGGEVDLLDDETARQAALFGQRIEIMNGVYPAFADCGVSVRPSSLIMYHVNQRYGLGLSLTPPKGVFGRIQDCLIYSFPNSFSQEESLEDCPSALPERTWFDEAGVLIGRPGSFDNCAMAVALKGGHNAEHHNHNDVGSYLVVVGTTAVLLDPGGEFYTRRTFSAQRYESGVLNSFGHPVPLVAGKLQSNGRQAEALVLEKHFSETTDTLVLDITSAYDVKELKRLTRSFTYSREGTGSLRIVDEVEFTEPTQFGTALITLGSYLTESPNRILVTDEEETVQVDIETHGSDFVLSSTTIEEDVRAKCPPTRIGIDLVEPVMKAQVVMLVTCP